MDVSITVCDGATGDPKGECAVILHRNHERPADRLTRIPGGSTL